MRQLSLILVLWLAFVSATPAVWGTKLVTTWKDPEATKLSFNKIAVAFMGSDADLRNRVEDGLARRIRRSVTARSFVPDSELRDREAVRTRLTSNSVDGVLVVRLLDIDKSVTLTEGPTTYTGYPMFWDAWDTFWSASTPIYAIERKVITVEIVLYSVTTAKPIWAGQMKSTNEKSLRVLLDNLVKNGAEELRKQKLI
jgi:hypothetical protein